MEPRRNQTGTKAHFTFLAVRNRREEINLCSRKDGIAGGNAGEIPVAEFGAGVVLICDSSGQKFVTCFSPGSSPGSSLDSLAGLSLVFSARSVCKSFEVRKRNQAGAL